jgi:hypothetical protein
MLARHFPWDTDLIAGIVVADMALSDQCNWNEAFSRVGAPITVLEANQPFSSPAEYGFGAFRPRSETQRLEAMDVAASEVMRLSLEFLDRLP